MSYANDNAANATTITGSSGAITPFHYDGISDPATSESGESSYGAGETLWWKWTAPSAADITIATSGSPSDDGDPNGLDTQIQIFDGSPTGAVVASNDDGGVSTYPYNSRCTFTPVVGHTYFIQVDMYGTGQAGTLHLTWAAAPPPAPVAGSWSEAPGRDFHTAFAGDDISVTGAHLDTVDTVTIGGFPQSFTVVDAGHLTVHVDGTARSGPITVANATASDDASGDATMLFYGPWIQPPDTTATLDSGHFFGSTYGNDLDSPIRSTTQPDFTGSPVVNTGAAALVEVSSATLDPNWDWNFRGGVVSLDARDPTQTMPTTDPRVFFAGSGTEWDYEFEADHGTALTDPVISFDARVEDPSGNHVEDTNNRSLSEDLWQTTMQFRRLPGSDWAYDTGYNAYLLSGAWPSPSSLAALPLDSEQPTLDPGATLELSSLTGADGAAYTDNYAQLLQGTDPGYADAQTVTWTDFGDSRAWAFSFNLFIDGTALTPPVVSPTAYATGNALHRKLLTGLPYVRATWTYRPPRYRIIYTEPVAVNGWQVGSVAW